MSYFKGTWRPIGKAVPIMMFAYYLAYTQLFDNVALAIVLVHAVLFVATLVFVHRHKATLALTAFGTYMLVVNVTLHYLQMRDLFELGLAVDSPFASEYTPSWGMLPWWSFTIPFIVGVACLAAAVVLFAVQQMRSRSQQIGITKMFNHTGSITPITQNDYPEDAPRPVPRNHPGEHDEQPLSPR